MTLLDECILLLSDERVLFVISDIQDTHTPIKKKTYTVDEIATLLNISKKSAYLLVKTEQFNYVELVELYEYQKFLSISG